MRKRLFFLKIFILLNIVFFSISSYGQDFYRVNFPSSDSSQKKVYIENKNAVYFELGGNGGVVSLNFDYRIDNHFGFRFGIGAYPKADETASDPNSMNINPDFIVMGNYLFFDEPVQIEFGVGSLIDLTTKYKGGFLPNKNSRFKPTLFLGPRYQPINGKYIIRIGYTPFFDLSDYFNYFGFSFGFSVD